MPVLSWTDWNPDSARSQLIADDHDHVVQVQEEVQMSVQAAEGEASRPDAAQG